VQAHRKGRTVRWPLAVVCLLALDPPPAMATRHLQNQPLDLVLDKAVAIVVGELVRYVDVDDAWVRRAAIAGLVLADGRQRFIDLAAEDLRRLLDTADPESEMWNLREGHGLHPTYFAFTLYRLDRRVWGRATAEAPRRLRELYRIAATHPKLSGDVSWWYGADRLCQSGADEDLSLVGTFLDDPDLRIRTSAAQCVARRSCP